MCFSICVLLKAGPKIIKDFFLSKVTKDKNFLAYYYLKHIESEVSAPSMNNFLTKPNNAGKAF